MIPIESDCNSKVDSRRRIRVVRGKYSGNYGYTLRPRGEQFYYVTLDNIPGELYVKKTSFEYVDETTIAIITKGVAPDRWERSCERTTKNEAVAPDVVPSGEPIESVMSYEKRSENVILYGAISPDVVDSWSIVSAVTSKTDYDKDKIDRSISSSWESTVSFSQVACQTKEFQIGQLVRFIGSDRKLKGKTGSITGMDRHYYLVTITGTNETVRKTYKTLELIESSVSHGDGKYSPLSLTTSTKRSQRDQSSYTSEGQTQKLNVVAANNCKKSCEEEEEEEKFNEAIFPDVVSSSWGPKLVAKPCEIDKIHGGISPDAALSMKSNASVQPCEMSSEGKEEFYDAVSAETESSRGPQSSSDRVASQANEFQFGQLIRFIGSDRKLKGKTGTITGMDRQYYLVTITGTNETVRKTYKTLELLDSSVSHGDGKYSPLSQTMSTKRSQRDQSSYTSEGQTRNFNVVAASSCTKSCEEEEKFNEAISPDVVSSWGPKLFANPCEIDKLYGGISPYAVSSMKSKASVPPCEISSEGKEEFYDAVSAETESSRGPQSSSDRVTSQAKEFQIGQLIRFIGSDRKLKGKTGTITGMDRHYYLVTITGTNETVRKTYKTLELLDSSVSQGDGKYSPLSPITSTKRSQRDRSPYTSKGKTIQSKLQNIDELNKWRVVDSDKGEDMIGSRRIVKSRIQSISTIVEETFLEHILQSRIVVNEIPLNQVEMLNGIDITYERGGCRYELILAKVYSDGEVGCPHYMKAKCVHTIYMLTRGPYLTAISPKDELMKLVDFSSLESSRKVVARLELLYSPLYKFKDKSMGIFFLDTSLFCEVPGHGIDGCGFISDTFLVELLGNNKDAKRAIAIQVRILIPSMGLYKGVLNRKRIVAGPPVQLVSSMKKVGPSRMEGIDDRACLMITKNGVHPSKPNHYVHRLLNPEETPPPESFEIKRLKDMITRLWCGLGVPKDLSDKYVALSTKRQYLNHAWVVGVADPTDGNLLPAGHAFVTGMKHALNGYEQIFVTRSPCILPTDGRMCPLVSKKPDNMPDDAWDDLINRPFGSIIFATPNEGAVPLPEIIAEGDLDGDLYFICWNKEILNSIQTIAIEENFVMQEEEKPVSINPFWFDETQELLASTFEVHGPLIGKLYNLANEAADKSKWGIYDEDAMAFGMAYKDSLDFGKHGGQINLPSRLHSRIPANLRKFLTDSNVTNYSN